VALGLLTALPGYAATPAPVPAAIANHEGPIRIAVIRNLGSDDNTTQFVAGAIQEGKKLGFKVSTFLSNGDDAKFQDFVNQAISQKYDGIILSQGRDPYSTALVKKAVDAGIKVSVFDTAVNGEIPGVTVTQQDDASLTNLSFGQLAKDFNSKANIVKLWVAGSRRWSAARPRIKSCKSSIRTSKSWNPSGQCLLTSRATRRTKWALFWRNTRKVKSTPSGEPGTRSARAHIRL
jgi:ABC-type sugar transport system substrate-binding protein